MVAGQGGFVSRHLAGLRSPHRLSDPEICSSACTAECFYRHRQMNNGLNQMTSGGLLRHGEVVEAVAHDFGLWAT